ncbi:Flp family type IVb pilin [Mesorhizobium sp. YIM 152430]|uniref:Flp family type IVb pilin n=1 Tax=Mesorhizobium sp. YIM 152430 TaxID=3031761 RepID=UPI0023DA7C1F|nr:Flp family type IVb pilin [Mesorhizobium sp. YIM 152430]MDF1599199.1 Flp family type IVb pilin [Mesorhizobium sp. YIM 152430]
MTRRAMWRRFLTDESGATAIEYGLIATLIGVAIIGGASATGTAISDLWGGNESKINEVLTR